MAALATKSNLAKLQDQLAEFGCHGFENDSIRLEALAAARELCSRLETAAEFIIRTTFGEPGAAAACIIGDDLGIFKILRDQKHEGQTVRQLATAVKADPEILRRILRLLAQRCIIKELGPDTFAGTTISNDLASPAMGSALHMIPDYTYSAFATLPTQFALDGYQNPTDSSKTAFTTAMKTDQNFFGWFNANPDALKHLQDYFAVYGSQRASWLDVYPAANLFSEKALKDDTVTVVDIGGGQGQDMIRLQQHYHFPPGKLVLQDQAFVLPNANVDERVVKMEYDFFKGPNPVKGALVYYMHHILHDWPDAQCLTILQHTKASMTKDYSKLMIFDNVVPRTNASTWAVTSDIVMMAMLAATERTEEMWRELFEAVGLKIVKVWQKPGVEEALLEVEIA